MSTDDETRWRGVAETAQHFGVGRNAVYEGCKNGWPHRRTGDGIRAAIKFDPVEDWPVISELLRPATAVPVARVPSTAQIDRGIRRRLPRRAAA